MENPAGNGRSTVIDPPGVKTKTPPKVSKEGKKLIAGQMGRKVWNWTKIGAVCLVGAIGIGGGFYRMVKGVSPGKALLQSFGIGPLYLD